MRNQLELPNMKIEISLMDEIDLMVLGGREPSIKWLNSLSFYDELWAVDRGLHPCLASGLLPHKIIGDKDSADINLWQRAVDSGAVEYKFPREKDATDFQLALDIFSKETAVKGLFLTGALGGRFDHLWSVILSFLYYSDKYRPVGLADENEGMIFLMNDDRAKITFRNKPLALSLISFSETCQGVFIDGVNWPLSDAVLEYRKPYSISNEVSENSSVEVKLAKGLLAIYWAQNSEV